MKQKKNLLLGFMFMFMIFSMLPCQTTQAMDYITLPAMENETTATFRADVPEGFTKDIEIFLNGSPYYMTMQSGYVMKVGLEPDDYEVRVILSDDITGQYQAKQINTFNPANDREITIQITETQDGSEVFEGGEEHHFENTQEQEKSIEPEIFDFSDGGEYGTILITREQYGAIQSATYHLVGANKVYDIPLDRDFVGQAKVLLPVGSYYESGTIDVELAQDAAVPDGTDFLWQHKDNMGNWGDYYTVTESETVTIDDLIIMLSLDGDAFEVDSSLLFSKTYNKNYESLAEKHRQEALESAFPEKYETSEAETIAAVTPVEETGSASLRQIIIVSLVAILVIFFIFLIIRIKISSKSKMR